MVLGVALYLGCNKVYIVKWQGNQVIFPGLFPDTSSLLSHTAVQQLLVAIVAH